MYGSSTFSILTRLSTNRFSFFSIIQTFQKQRIWKRSFKILLKNLGISLNKESKICLLVELQLLKMKGIYFYDNIARNQSFICFYILSGRTRWLSIQVYIYIYIYNKCKLEKFSLKHVQCRNCREIITPKIYSVMD